MTVQRISRAFKDISLSFNMHPITKDLTVLKNEDAIKRSIRNIVQTIPSERFFNPNFGSEVKSSLFEFVDFGTSSVIEQQIKLAIDAGTYHCTVHCNFKCDLLNWLPCWLNIKHLQLYVFYYASIYILRIFLCCNCHI